MSLATLIITMIVFSIGFFTSISAILILARLDFIRVNKVQYAVVWSFAISAMLCAGFWSLW